MGHHLLSGRTLHVCAQILTTYSLVALLCEQLVNVVHLGLLPELVVAKFARLRLHKVVILGTLLGSGGYVCLECCVASGSDSRARPLKAVIAELHEHLLDGGFMLLSGALLLLGCLGGSNVISLRSRVLEFAIPGLLNHRDLVLTELEPALKLASLFETLSSVCIFLFFAIHIIKSFLSEVFEFEGDLDNLAEIHAGGRLARRVVELIVCLKLILDKVLHRVEIFLVEGLPDEVQDKNALLV